uniref:Uncharacterized protein n=1 Tax=Eptatretus burgeri TaxID=7764 RepID=A0A8C4Q4R3_EPTBU
METRVKRQLSQSESERRQAAEYGLKLLEIQTEMQNRFYEEQQEMANKLEQQRFAASQEATLKSSLLSSLTAEYEAHKTENKNKIQDLEARLERCTTKRTHSLQAAVRLCSCMRTCPCSVVLHSSCCSL